MICSHAAPTQPKTLHITAVPAMIGTWCVSIGPCKSESHRTLFGHAKLRAEGDGSSFSALFAPHSLLDIDTFWLYCRESYLIALLSCLIRLHWSTECGLITCCHLLFGCAGFPMSGERSSEDEYMWHIDWVVGNTTSSLGSDGHSRARKRQLL